MERLGEDIVIEWPFDETLDDLDFEADTVVDLIVPALLDETNDDDWYVELTVPAAA
jgi:hypothetical protein